MKETIRNIKSIFLVLALLLAVDFIYAAWTNPTADPTGNNTPTPINVGSVAQVKNGGLSVNAFSAYQNSYFAANVGLGTPTPSVRLDIVGSIKIADGTQGANKVLTSDGNGLASWQTSAAGAMPSGVIVMWSGSVASIPLGWALADGTNGTPDLRDRFILGAGGSRPVGTTGGEEAHTLTIAEIPSHTHGYNETPWTGSRYDGHSSPLMTSQQWAQTSATGGGQAHNNMPPYYVLAFIMKL